MKRKFILIQVLLTAILMIMCCVALIACGTKEPQAPEVKDVTITAVDASSYGKAGALHQLNYTATEGSTVSTSVKLGDHAATASDYSCIDGGYIFYTAGEYTVTVYAAKDGMLGSANAKITVTVGAVSVSNVVLREAAGEAYGKVGALHVLSYTADAGSEIQVEIKKGDVVATDVIFDSAYHTVIFGSAGTYTVKVTATLGLESDSAQTQIEITAMGAPAVTLSLDKSTVAEDGEVTLSRTATYEVGDSGKEEHITALYRAGTSGEYRTADEGTYTLIGDRFTPHKAGSWKIVYSVLGVGGGAGEAGQTLTCNPAELTLLPKSAGRHRIQTQQPTDIDYDVRGAADKYDVTYNLHGATRIEAAAGAGHSVRITASDVDYFTVTVVYTHKVVKTLQKSVDIDVYSVDSLLYAPAWGDDPFDGMPSDVLTSMGHLLYFNATSCGGNQRELTYQDVKYEVIESRLSTSGVELLYGASDNVNYPYIIVSNFNSNVATGNFTLKMTITDPATGYSAIATKKFEVIPTTNTNSTAAKKIQSYVQEHSDFFHMGNMNFENLSSDCRQNMVLTKTGTIMQRSNPYWPLQDDASENRKQNSDFALMNFESASANNRFEFKFTLLAPNPTSGAVWLGIGMRTVTTNGWVGFFDLHAADGKLTITNGLGAASSETRNTAQEPLVENGMTLFIRIDRSVSGNLVEYAIYTKTEEPAPYTMYYRCSYTSSTAAGNAGAPVKQYQFTHRNAGGCYAVENVSITDFGA